MNSSPQLSARRRRIWWSKALPIGIIAAALVVTVVSVALAKTFPDVPGDYPYATAISHLADQGVIDGYSDGRFGPSDPVKRQQFAKLMILAAGQTATEADVTSFTDVIVSGPGSLYPDNYVAKIASLGITLGKTATTFDPYAFITRAQMITMVVRAADNLFPGTLGTPPADYVSTWDPSFSAQHGQNARKAEYNHLLEGLPLSTLDPLGNMPRGEVAQVLYNFENLVNPSGTTTTSAGSTTTTVPATTTTTVHATTTTTSQATTTTTVGGGAHVVLLNFQISPATVNINVGQSVTWTNNDPFNHHLVGDLGQFDSGIMGQGTVFTFRFTTAGTVAYHCSIHPSMTGTVIVH